MNGYLPDRIGKVVGGIDLPGQGGVSLAASFIAVFSHGLACLEAPATYFNLLTSLFFYLMVFCFLKIISSVTSTFNMFSLMRVFYEDDGFASIYFAFFFSLGLSLSL